jgi:putative sterol carrier protein
MSSKKEIEEALRDVINKFNDPKVKPRFANFSKIIQFNFPDINANYIIKVIDGNVESINEEKIDNANIYITVESKIFLDIIIKKINPMTAYTTGKLKAKGNMLDILKLQKIL